MKHLEHTVYPSTHRSIAVANDNDIYGGAHHYILENSTGFAAGETQYGGGTQSLQFVHKSDDGTITPGVLDQQVVIILLDRVGKLNARFPCEENDRMIEGLEQYLAASQQRVQNRINRGVMGELKK